jgi:hypothetical protein
MKSTWTVLLAAALLGSAVACHHDNKAEQLKALDSAYQSGVFTKEEYDAKKAALLGSPAAAPAPAPAPAPQVQPPMPPLPNPSDASATAAGAGTPAAAPPPPAPEPAPRRPSPLAPVPPPVQVPPAQTPRSPLPPAQTSAAEPPGNAAADELEPAPMAGCEDAEYKSSGGKDVQERFFPASLEAVHKAAVLAFKNLDFIVHVDTSRQMEASKKRHFSAVVGAGGERLILHFASAQKGGQSGTRVTGETKKSFVGRLAQKTWTSAVMAQIACNLGGRH